jgi:ribonuclease BN (tRNA processing enzyme)
MAERRGWGHSTYEEAVTLAMEGEAHNLILTHHDPSRSDVAVEHIIEAARQLAAGSDNPHYIDAAREGACYRLP